MPRRASIGRAELETLRYIADHQPVTVRMVAEHLAETKGQKRTTALNVMERLRAKGFLTREKAGAVFVYSPSRSKAQLLTELVREFVEGALGGSLEPFVAYLTQRGDLSPAEVEELTQLVDRLEERPKEERG